MSGANYGYDPHGRQNIITDARNGATTTAFNNADLPVAVTTPVPSLGLPAQVTSNVYSLNLQATQVILPDGASVFTDFYPTGEIKRQYGLPRQSGATAGGRIYPVGYSYDYAGSIKFMTN